MCVGGGGVPSSSITFLGNLNNSLFICILRWPIRDMHFSVIGFHNRFFGCSVSVVQLNINARNVSTAVETVTPRVKVSSLCKPVIKI